MESKYLERIKNISKISISKICKDLKIDRSNLLNGKTTKENEKIVYDTIIKEFKKNIEESKHE